MESISKLIVCGVHLFKDKRYRYERKAWEDQVKRAQPPGVEIFFIPLSLTDLLNGGKRDQPFDDGMRKFLKRIEKIREIQKIQSGQKEYTMSYFNYKIQNTVIRVLARRPSIQSRSFTRYMFIADELAAWLVKELMFRDSDIRKETVALVFRGMRMPDDLGASASSSHGASTKDSEGIISEYLIQLKSEFQVKTNQRAWQEGGLWKELVQADESFAKLNPTLHAVSWQITTDQRCDKLTPRDRDSVIQDLHHLTKATLTALEEPLENANDVRARVTANGNRVKDELQRAKHSFVLPIGMYEKLTSPDDRFSANNPKPGATTLTPAAGILSPEICSGISNMKNQAFSYFYANNVKNADRLFSACTECSPWMDQQPQEEKLEIALYHGVTWLHLGRYHEARQKLEEALDGAEALSDNTNKDKGDSLAFDIQMHLMYWYSTTLSRLGYYKEAQQKLEELVKITKGNSDHADACYGRCLEVRIKAHHSLSVIRNQTGSPGSFKSIDDDQDLFLSKKLLKRFEKDFPEIRKQYFQRPEYVPQEERSYGTEEQTFFRTMYAEEPAILQTQFDLARSRVLIHQGFLDLARRTLENLLRELKEWLGLNNVLTLEVTVLLAGLLVNTSRVAEGEKLAAEARDRITEHLDENHPMAMDATYVLSVACTSQGRDEEALQASRRLCEQAKENNIFGADRRDRMLHPRVSTYYTQLSDAYIAVGHYKEAEKCLVEQIFEADETKAEQSKTDESKPDQSKVDHQNKSYQREPDEVKHTQSTEDTPSLTKARNHSHLAWTRVHLGKYQGAGMELNKALKILLNGFQPNLDSHSPNDPTGSTNWRPMLLKNSKTLLQQANSLSKKQRNATSIHPDILFTLQVCSELESRQDDADLEFVLQINEAVYESLCKLLGENSTETLRARLSWGHAQNAFGHTRGQPRSFFDAFVHFDQVFTCCRTQAHLYQDHPLSLEAKRERWLSKINLGQIAETEVKQSVEVLAIIKSSQQRSLGPDRPQTLRTGLCHLSAILAVIPGANPEEAEDLFVRLRDPELQEQRLIESLLMRERLAQICFRAGLHEVSTKIMKDLLSTPSFADGDDKDPENDKDSENDKDPKKDKDHEIKVYCREIIKRAMDSQAGRTQRMAHYVGNTVGEVC